MYVIITIVLYENHHIQPAYIIDAAAYINSYNSGDWSAPTLNTTSPGATHPASVDPNLFEYCHRDQTVIIELSLLLIRVTFCGCVRARASKLTCTLYTTSQPIPIKRVNYDLMFSNYDVMLTFQLRINVGCLRNKKLLFIETTKY